MSYFQFVMGFNYNAAGVLFCIKWFKVSWLSQFDPLRLFSFQLACSGSLLSRSDTDAMNFSFIKRQLKLVLLVATLLLITLVSAFYNGEFKPADAIDWLDVLGEGSQKRVRDKVKKIIPGGDAISGTITIYEMK